MILCVFIKKASLGPFFLKRKMGYNPSLEKTAQEKRSASGSAPSRMPERGSVHHAIGSIFGVAEGNGSTNF